MNRILNYIPSSAVPAHHLPDASAPRVARSRPSRNFRSSDEIATDLLSSSVWVEGVGRRFEIKIASTRDEYQQAFRLLAQKYQERGYESKTEKSYRFTPFHAMPETITVVARVGTEVLGTLSFVPDTPLLGLPLDSIYGEEANQLREQGRRLGEVTSLADHDLAGREFVLVFEAMRRLVNQYHAFNGGDTWVIAVHPRHKRYYTKVLGFEQLGPTRAYPSVCDAPAEGLVCTLESLQAHPETYDRMLGPWFPDSVLIPPPRESDHARFFGRESTAISRLDLERILRRMETDGTRRRWSLCALNA